MTSQRQTRDFGSRSAAVLSLAAAIMAAIATHATGLPAAARGGQAKSPPFAAVVGGDRSHANSEEDTGVARRAVLSEEDPNHQSTGRFEGSVVWHFETASGGPGRPTQPVIYACITIPGAGMSLVWSLRPNAGGKLLLERAHQIDPMEASHTAIMTFTLPADFSHRGIFNVIGLLTKREETARSEPLTSLSAKVITNLFFTAFFADLPLAPRNFPLLKSGSWFELPIVYDDHHLGRLSFEKGPSGERIFARAFATWGGAPPEGNDTVVKRTTIRPETCPPPGPVASR